MASIIDTTTSTTTFTTTAMIVLSARPRGLVYMKTDRFQEGRCLWTLSMTESVIIALIGLNQNARSSHRGVDIMGSREGVQIIMNLPMTWHLHWKSRTFIGFPLQPHGMKALTFWGLRRLISAWGCKGRCPGRAIKRPDSPR